MRISVIQIIILILFIFLLFGDLNSIKKRLQNVINFVKKKIK